MAEGQDNNLSRQWRFQLNCFQSQRLGQQITGSVTSGSRSTASRTAIVANFTRKNARYLACKKASFFLYSELYITGKLQAWQAVLQLDNLRSSIIIKEEGGSSLLVSSSLYPVTSVMSNFGNGLTSFHDDIEFLFFDLFKSLFVRHVVICVFT